MKQAIPDDCTKYLKYKSELETRGFPHQNGTDYNATIVPVVRLARQRWGLAIVATEKLGLHQMDVKISFKYGSIHEKHSLAARTGWKGKISRHRLQTTK